MSLSCLANVKRNNESSRPDVQPHVVFASYVGDRSGSMCRQEKASANGVYEWVKEMCSGVINGGQKGFISVTFFDSLAEKRLVNVPMDKVEISIEQARDWSEPRNSTKLYDTAIEAINTLRRNIKSYKSSHPELRIHGVFQLFTDGHDNKSMAQSHHLQAAIEGARNEGISCIYLGIGQNAIKIGKEYGFEEDQSLSVDVGEETSEFAFRGCSMNALRCASTGESQAIPECLRQSSAPSQSFHRSTIGVPAFKLNPNARPFNLKQ